MRGEGGGGGGGGGGGFDKYWRGKVRGTRQTVLFEEYRT